MPKKSWPQRVGCPSAVKRGVCVEHLEVIKRRAFQAAILGERIARRSAVENLAKAERDLAGKIGDHPAHVMGDDLQAGQLIKQAGIDQPRHAGRGLIGPAEAEPDFVFGGLLACIICKLRAAHGMHPDRQIMRNHAFEDGPELRPAQRLTSDIGEYLNAAGAKASDRTVDFGQRRVDIVHRQCGNEGREVAGIFRTETGQRVIGNACQFRGYVWRPDKFERRVGQ